MSDTGLEISDMVTSNQDKEANTLKKVLDLHDLEKELPEYEPETYDPPIELKKDIYLWELKEDLPEDLPDANYVIIDVVYFSTTAVEALSNGVDSMYLGRSHDEVLNLKTSKGVKAGGEAHNNRPREGFDFFNSPSNVKNNGIDGDVAMTSDNGAVAALKVNENTPESADIYIGTTSNAKAVGEALKDSDRPVHIICSGTRGSYAAEDHIGAYLIARYLGGQPLDSSEIEILRSLLETVKNYIYEDSSEVRQIDIQEHVKAVNSRDVVPKLVSSDDAECLKPIPKV